MARIRSIKPELPGDEKLATVSRDARLTFILAMTQVDDDGLLAASPRQLLGSLFPLDDSVTPALLEAWIGELIAIGRVRWRRTRDAARVLELCNWKKHQKIDKPSPSKITPLLAPFDEGSQNPREQFAKVRRIEREVDVGSGIGSGVVDLCLTTGESTIRVENPVRERPANGPPLSEANGTATPEPTAAPADGITHAAVKKFIGHFYAAAVKHRKQDVLDQLAFLLTPSGVSFQGHRVRAVDGQHLRDTMLAVTAKPPADRDKAVVFVLKKLNDTYTEVHSARHKEARPSIDAGSSKPVRIGALVAGMAR